jgi:ubiquinone/menaquinone biosynthesis C-methylase UbiE
MPEDWNEAAISDYLISFQDPAGARVVDIGVGDGKRTTGFTERAGYLIGIDPNKKSLLENPAAYPRSSDRRVHLIQARAQDLPFQSESFDIALLSWSL